MEFGSVDPAAFIFAVIAVLISVEQLARSNEHILDDDFKTIIAHICSITLPRDKGLNHYKKLNKKYHRLLIEKGFTPWEMTMNGNHPAQGALWKKIWSGLFVSAVAKLLRKRMVFLAFITAFMGYIITIPLRLWLFFLFNCTRCSPWKKRTILRWTGKNNIHLKGYNGQQFDKFIISWISQLGWSSNEEMEEIVTWVAYLASWTGSSKIIGPTCAVRLAIGEDINIGDIIADGSLLLESIQIYYIDQDIRADVLNQNESFQMILTPPKIPKNDSALLRIIYQWEYRLHMINKIWWLPHNENQESDNILTCKNCLSNECTIGRLPLYLNDINDIKEYDKFYLGIIPSLNISNVKYE